MKIRFAKVRVSNQRTAPATVGLDRLTDSQRRDADTHDKFVRDYTAEMLAEAFDDLEHRAVYDRRDPEHRWVMGRRAALARAASRMKGGRA